MKPAKPQPFQTYGAAILTTAIAIVLAQGTVLSLGMGSPFLLPIAAIVVSAWYGGWGPGRVVKT